MKKKGFTFIEILVTLAIIGTLFIPVMRLFSHSLYSSSVSQDLITATNLAEWQMERLKNLGYTKKELRVLGDKVYPQANKKPIEMNDAKWRIKQIIFKEKDPVEVRVSVYKEGEGEPLITLVTLIEDTFWEEVQPII